MSNMVTLNKIILFLICYACILTKTKVYSQDFNKIKKADTVYIYFKKTEYKQIHLPQPKEYGDFYFVFDEFYKNKNIIFSHSPLTPEEKKEKKSFLKKNKGLLIDYNFLTNMFSYQDAKEILLSKKRIYLIDYDDIGWFKIKLLEVKVNNYDPYPIE